MKTENKGYTPKELERMEKEVKETVKKWWSMGFSLGMIILTAQDIITQAENEINS